MKVQKKPADRTPVPQDAVQAAEFLAEIGMKQRFLGELQSQLDQNVSDLKEEAEERARQPRERIAELTRGLEIWATANRQALTLGRTKTITLATGLLRWRQAPPRVEVKAPKTVLSVIVELGLTQFLRTKQEIDKEALLKAPEAAEKIPGVAIVQGEAFEVEPTRLELVQGGEG